MNRAMRRQAYREGKRSIAEIQRNGITLEHLKKNYDIGFDEGFKAGTRWVYRLMFARLGETLRELFGFGPVRNLRTMNDLYQRVVTTVNTEEAVEEAWEKLGLQIRFDDPFNPVEVREQK